MILSWTDSVFVRNWKKSDTPISWKSMNINDFGRTFCPNFRWTVLRSQMELENFQTSIWKEIIYSLDSAWFQGISETSQTPANIPRCLSNLNPVQDHVRIWLGFCVERHPLLLSPSQSGWFNRPTELTRPYLTPSRAGVQIWEESHEQWLQNLAITKTPENNRIP